MTRVRRRALTAVRRIGCKWATAPPVEALPGWPGCLLAAWGGEPASPLQDTRRRSSSAANGQVGELLIERVQPRDARIRVLH